MQWNHLEGKLLAGAYPLGVILRTGDDRAWFATQFRQKPATILVAQLPKEEAEQQLANLEAASRVKHTNLVSIERVGRSRLDGITLIYAVMENTEEDLAAVLRERALTPEETAEMTESLVAALAALHEQGMLHGAIRATHVLAAGETVKLRSDCAYKVPTAAKPAPEIYAQDVGDMGALIFEALTQRQLTSPDEPAIRKLPVPFRAIVQSAVTGRWGLADISAALKKTVVEPHHPVPATALRESTGKNQASRSAAKPAAALHAQPVAATGARVDISARRAGNHTIRMVAVLAILVALALIWFHYRSAPPSLIAAADPLQAPVPAPAIASANPASASSSPQQAPPPTVAADAPHPDSPAPVAPTPDSNDPDAAGKPTIWRVVVYTYASEGEAQQKVEHLLQTHPELNPEVFTPTGESPFLVTIGGKMTHARAVAVRTEATRAGLPRDAYAQNFSR